MVKALLAVKQDVHATARSIQDARSLAALVDAAYAGALAVTGATALDLLVDADTLLFAAARKACCTFLARKVDAGSCLTVLASPQLGGIGAHNEDVRALLDCGDNVGGWRLEAGGKKLEVERAERVIRVK